MRVMGDRYFLLNFGLDLLSLLMAARLIRVPVRFRRLLPAALLGAGYALAALNCPRLGSLPVFLACLLALCFLAFGKRGVSAFPAVCLSCVLLSGFLRLGIRQKWPRVALYIGCALLLPGLCFLLAKGSVRLTRQPEVLLVFRGKRLRLPAFRDSGNTLFDPWTGLPVLVVSVKIARPLLPDSLNIRDFSTLPPGFRLLRVRTAAGEKTLMCFHPEEARVISGRREKTVDLLAALSETSLPRALLPEAIFHQEAIVDHANP